MGAAVDGEKPNGPRSRKGIRTRARLVEAAKRVFEESGFLDARISDIAERAELSHGSFYHYFESKEEIFREVAGALEEQLSAHSVVDSGLLDATSGASMRERLTESNRRYLEDYRNESRIMGVIEQVSRYDDEVRAARLARQQQYTEQTGMAIRRLQRQGLADSSLDPTIAASALTAMVTRFAEMWFVQGQVNCTFDQGVEQIATLCMNALQVKDKVDTPRRRRLKAT
jgi:AcrR family transcriptional regulator